MPGQKPLKGYQGTNTASGRNAAVAAAAIPPPPPIIPAANALVVTSEDTSQAKVSLPVEEEDGINSVDGSDDMTIDVQGHAWSTKSCDVNGKLDPYCRI